MGKNQTANTVHVSPRRAKQLAKQRARQEKGWRARSSEVVTYKVGEARPEIPLPTKQPRKTMKRS